MDETLHAGEELLWLSHLRLTAFQILAINHAHHGRLQARGHAEDMLQSLQHLPKISIIT